MNQRLNQTTVGATVNGREPLSHLDRLRGSGRCNLHIPVWINGIAFLTLRRAARAVLFPNQWLFNNFPFNFNKSLICIVLFARLCPYNIYRLIYTFT